MVDKEARRRAEQETKTGAEAEAQGRGKAPGWVPPQSEDLGSVAQPPQRDITGKALRSLWGDRCTLTVREEVADPNTHLTEFREAVRFEDEPCRLSFGALATSVGEPLSAVKQTVKVFLDPALEVPPGSKLTITHKGRTEEYTQSGKAAVYSAHQEIPVELFGGWA